MALEKEFEYFLKNHDKLVREHRGKFVVIKGCAVVGVYDSELQAVAEASKEHELGTFLVQICLPGEDSYTATYHSRVAFA